MNYRTILIILVFLTGILPSIFPLGRPLYNFVQDAYTLGGGILAVDVVLMVMFGSVVYKFGRKEIDLVEDKYLLNLLILFCIYMFFEVAIGRAHV